MTDKPVVDEAMMRRALAASENRDYSKSEYEYLRSIVAAALLSTDEPLIDVTDEMTRSGISAYKFAMWRSLCYSTTTEETLAYVYRAMAKHDRSRKPAPTCDHAWQDGNFQETESAPLRRTMWQTRRCTKCGMIDPEYFRNYNRTPEQMTERYAPPRGNPT